MRLASSESLSNVTKYTSPNSNGLLHRCGECKRIEVYSGEWISPAHENYPKFFDYYGEDKVSDGYCPECVTSALEKANGTGKNLGNV